MYVNLNYLNNDVFKFLKKHYGYVVFFLNKKV